MITLNEILGKRHFEVYYSNEPAIFSVCLFDSDRFDVQKHTKVFERLHKLQFPVVVFNAHPAYKQFLENYSHVRVQVIDLSDLKFPGYTAHLLRYLGVTTSNRLIHCCGTDNMDLGPGWSGSIRQTAFTTAFMERSETQCHSGKLSVHTYDAHILDQFRQHILNTPVDPSNWNLDQEVLTEFFRSVSHYPTTYLLPVGLRRADTANFVLSKLLSKGPSVFATL